MQIEARGVVYNAVEQPETRRIAFFTGLCAQRSGKIWCGFQVGSAKHAINSTLVLCSSRDGGRTWSESNSTFDTTLDGVPGSMSAPALVEVGPGRLLLFASWFDRSEPTRPLFDPVTEGILHSRLLLAVSTDDGQSWSPWKRLTTGELNGCSGTGPILAWADGKIAYPFESFKEYDDPRPGRHAAWLLVSEDGGQSFGPPVLVAQDPEHKVYYWDQRLCATRTPGEFYGLFWTHHLAEQIDLNVHVGHGQLKDGYAKCDPIQETSIPGQISAPLWLDDGRLLAFVVDRNRPGTMKLWSSHDGGQTWPAAECLTVHTHDEQAALAQKSARVDFAEYWEDMGKWSFGHPAIVQLDEERVLLAWYAGTPDRMSVHWCRINIVQ